MDLARLELGLLVAVMLPRTFPGMNRSYLASSTFTILYGAYAIFPVVHGWRSWILWILTILVGIGRDRFPSTRRSVEIGEESADLDRSPPRYTQSPGLRLRISAATRSRNLALVIGLLLLFAVSSLLYLESQTTGVLSNLVNDNRISIVLSGLLAASFIGQEFVIPLVRPFADKLEKDTQDPQHVGHTSAYVGWIERALVFAFVAGGQPAAAALAITAKTLVRIPQLDDRDGRFVEYVLIGTLASLLVALVFAVGVRLALGSPPI